VSRHASRQYAGPGADPTTSPTTATGCPVSAVSTETVTSWFLSHVATRSIIGIHVVRWRIPEAKTDAGERDVELTAYTLDELRSHLATRHSPARGPLFRTRTGGRLNASNIRNRLLPEAAQRANARRERAGRMLLPHRVTRTRCVAPGRCSP
jgi:hypothetical protein